MAVEGVDKVLGDDVAAHLQAGDVGVEPAAHLRPGESAGSPQLAGDEAALFAQCAQDGLFNGALGGDGVNAAAVVAEVGPPLAADESRLAGKELAVDAVSISHYRAFPFPQRPVPAAVGHDHVAAVVVDNFLGRESPDATVEKGQEPHLLDMRHQLGTTMYFGVSHTLSACFGAKLLKTFNNRLAVSRFFIIFAKKRTKPISRMKFISWNVNGLRACEGKGFSDVFRQLDADFFCLQETKMQAGQLDLQFEGYQSFWNYADKKGYSGTAIYTRHQPLSVGYGIGVDEHDHEGRVITVETEDFFLVTAYVPNSQDELKRLDYRMRWEDDFLAYLQKLDERKPVIVCGDLNVAHEEIDLKNPKTNRRNAGFTDEERQKFSRLLDSGFTDTFRWKYPEQVTYSWWSYRFQARQKNAGWRIDYFVVSNRLRDRIKDAKIHTDILGSDHCPVELELL